MNKSNTYDSTGEALKERSDNKRDIHFNGAERPTDFI